MTNVHGPDGSILYAKPTVTVDEEARRLESLGWRIVTLPDRQRINVLGHRSAHVRKLAFGRQAELPLSKETRP